MSLASRVVKLLLRYQGTACFAVREGRLVTGFLSLYFPGVSALMQPSCEQLETGDSLPGAGAGRATEPGPPASVTAVAQGRARAHIQTPLKDTSVSHPHAGGHLGELYFEITP